MQETPPSRWRALWVLPPVLIGVLVLILAAGGREPPQRVERDEISHPVRVVEAREVDLVPTAEGYGEVKPARIWAAVAQVAGRIVEIHPQLRDGEILPEGTLLLRIDPVDYELKRAQARAELAELDVQAQNNQASLALDERNLRLAQRERERVADLAATGTASQSEVDNAERAVINARTAVQNTQNTLALLPTRRRLLEARLAQAERDLANTVLRAPFDLRVADLAVEQDQYVGIGQTLFRGDSTDRVEIVAQVAMGSLRRLFVGGERRIPSVAEMQTRLAEFTGFRPLVRMDLGGPVAEWPAEFVRFSDQVDPATRTLGVVVAVDRPLDLVIPGQRPPLSKGMFVQVLIRGRVQPDRVVVPRAALRAGQVHLVDADNRLHMSPVEVAFTQGPLAVIEAGVAAGDRVVLSDLVPAVEGMRLEPQPDESVRALMARAAHGDAP
jgi:RND family efflux transporter MFP subunit